MPTVPVSNGQVTLSDDMLRLLVWIVCDGTILAETKKNPNSTKRRVQFKLSRPEKLERLQILLLRMGVRFTFKPATMSPTNRLQPYYIRIYGDDARLLYSLLDGIKRFPAWMSLLDRHQMMVVIEALTHTDGGWSWRKIQWVTTSVSDKDLICGLCDKFGIIVTCKEKKNASGFKIDCKPQFEVRMAFEEDGHQAWRNNPTEKYKRELFAECAIPKAA